MSNVCLEDLVGAKVIKVEMSNYDITLILEKDNRRYKVEFFSCATEGFSKVCENGDVVYIQPEEIEEHSYVEVRVEEVR